MAPGAQLYLVNFESAAEFGNAVSYAIDQGVDIVSCSAGWIDAGPFDGTGPVCDIVNQARDSGVFWAQSSGDVANKHWEGPWSDPDSDGVHNFTAGDDGQSITVSANRIIEASLVWEDPWGASGNDHNLYLYDNHDQLVASSEDVQDGDDCPVESITHNVGPTGAGTYHLKIGKDLAASPVDLELYSLMDVFQHRVAESSLVVPADATGAVACGAVYWLTDGLEVFSSRGPANDGRLKPEFTAPDGVSTVSYPGGFYGASAATAHLAGAAALVLEAYPGYGVTDVVTYLTQYAVDLGSTGWDNGHGYGRLSLGPVPNHPPLVGTITPGSGSCEAGQLQQFSTTWQDSDGWQDLKQCWFHIGADASVGNSVTLMYNAVKDRLWLLNNDATTWTGGYAPGSAHVLQNNQAKVYCWESSANGTGDTLHLTWAIEFKPDFTGDKKLGLKCKDRHKARARGQWKGTWTIVESAGSGQEGAASEQPPGLDPTRSLTASGDSDSGVSDQALTPITVGHLVKADISG